MPTVNRNPPSDDRLMSARASSYVWYFVAYPESTSLPDLLNDIAEACYNYAYILHDKDCNPDGTPKKPHWHIAVWRDRPTTYKMVTTALNIGYAERPKKGCNLGTYLVYMTHSKQPDKYQYLPDSIVTNVSRETLESLMNEPMGSDSKTLDLLDDIQKLAEGTLTYRDFYSLHPRFLYCPSALSTLITQLS